MTGYSVTTLIIALIVGLIIGGLLVWLFLRGNRREKQQHKQMMEKFDHYRDDVDRHFVETAAAVDELNRSYRNVVEHLSKGAQQLMNDDTLKEQLENRSGKNITVGFSTSDKLGKPASKDDFPPPPPYTDAVSAEVVPLNGQPDRVAEKEQKNK